MTDEPRRRRRSHLLDPDDLRGSHLRSQGDLASLTKVQQWVASIIVVTTILHLAVVGVLLAETAEPSRMDARIGGTVMAGVIGIVAVGAGLAIHRRPVVSWWLLLGLVPGLVGTWLTFG